MPIEVLKTKADNEHARRELRRRGLDLTSSWLMRVVKKRIFKTVAIGDRRKNWDVLKTLEFLMEKVPRNSPVLDIGAYSSEVLCALHKMGYTDLSGIDLNPDIVMMPHAVSIRYQVGNFMQTPFPDAAFSAVTAVSVIEHGFAGDRLLAEMSRIVKPGGYFLASVDYWPDKIDTGGIKAFGLDWTIFARDEVFALVRQAASYGFSSFGTVDLDAGERAVNWQGKEYTFAWIVLQKNL
jgi:SAM-dependent methyltransferase